MARLIRGRAGPLPEIVAEARAVGRRSVMLAELAFLHSQLTQLQAANRAEDTRDKAYVTEQRLGALVTQLGSGAYPSTDGNNYDLTRLTVVLASAFTINSTTPQTILSHAVGIATYEIEFWAVCSNATPADPASFALSGPSAAVNPQLVDFMSSTTGATATTGYAASSTYTQAFSGLNATGNQLALMRATVQFTAAGTLAITGKETVSGNTITVFGGSRMRISRIVAT